MLINNKEQRVKRRCESKVMGQVRGNPFASCEHQGASRVVLEGKRQVDLGLRTEIEIGEEDRSRSEGLWDFRSI